jgi:Ulp1 family protease
MHLKSHSATSSYDANKLLLNYLDACIYGRDLAILEDSHGWLNADIIHFFGKRLEQEALSLSSSSLSNSSKILWMDPSVVSFFMHQLDDQDELQEFADIIRNDLHEKQLVLIPVNNVFGTSQWMQPHQGQHWSLLVYFAVPNTTIDAAETNDECSHTKSHSSGSFWHLDSIQNSANEAAAERVAHQWSRILRLVDTAAANDVCETYEQPALKVNQVPNVPKQQNGYDCGMHLLVAAQVLYEMAATSQQHDLLPTPLEWGKAIAAHLQRESTTDMRRRIAKEIRQLIKEQSLT